MQQIFHKFQIYILPAKCFFISGPMVIYKFLLRQVVSKSSTLTRSEETNIAKKYRFKSFFTSLCNAVKNVMMSFHRLEPKKKKKKRRANQPTGFRIVGILRSFSSRNYFWVFVKERTDIYSKNV